MNYQKIYNQLIEKRRINPIFRKDVYCQFHHIKPRSIYPNLIKDKNNIIALTAKEHYVAVKIAEMKDMLQMLIRFIK